ncbi:MAG: hypothetical protein KC912_18605 [Proteobacteria bacterium]|nr:hypothetical protein [Pseudomonadota bacterium]
MLHLNEKRRGTYAVIFGVTASMLLGFTSIAIDAGWHRLGESQLANAADAGAHAGSVLLDGTQEGVDAAVARAKVIAEANRVHGNLVVVPLPEQNILAGRYDNVNENDCALDDGCWSVLDSEYTGYSPSRTGLVTPADTNAVQVSIQSTVNTIFSTMPFGSQTLAVAQTATARLPITPGVGCAFPLTMPQCAIDGWMSGEACDSLVRLRLSSSQIDTVAWSSPVDGGTYDTLAAIADINGDACTSTWSEADIDDGEADVSLMNGQMNTAFHIISAQLDADTYIVDTDGDGQDEVLNYANARVGWDYTTWGPNCPGTLADTLCNAEIQGTCDCPNSQQDCIGSATATACDGNGGSWVSTCPTVAADCTNGVFLRRQMAVFNSSGVTCDANGNVQTQSSWNYNDDQDVSGFVTMLIYNIESQGQDKFLDAFISCRNAEGEDTEDTDGDGSPDAVHVGFDEVVESADKGRTAMVR